MITRKDYLDNKSVSHEDYYGDVVKAAGLDKLEFPKHLTMICVKEFRRGNHHFNETAFDGDKKIPELRLSAWDAWGVRVNSAFLSKAMKDRGDYVTPVGLVSVVKHIMRARVLEHIDKFKPAVQTDGSKLMRCLKDNYDSYDKWGWALLWLFAIADYLFWKLDADVPPEWEFRPGAGGYAEEDYDYEIDIMSELDVEQLIYLGNVLNRYLRLLKRHGEDY